MTVEDLETLRASTGAKDITYTIDCLEKRAMERAAVDDLRGNVEIRSLIVNQTSKRKVTVELFQRQHKG